MNRMGPDSSIGEFLHIGGGGGGVLGFFCNAALIQASGSFYKWGALQKAAQGSFQGLWG